MKRTINTRKFTGLPAAQRTFLAAPRFATVAVLRPNGTPLLSTVWYDLDGDKLWFLTAMDSTKLMLLRRDPRVGFHVVDPSGFPYFAANGLATIASDTPENTQRLHMANRYLGSTRGSQYVTENLTPVPFAVVHITIERTNSMGFE